MKTTTLLLTACLGLGIAAYAQDGGKKPDPAATPKPAAPQEKPTVERPKADAVTATDGDLRSRLARTAARKKLGADDATAAAAAVEPAAAGRPDEPPGETAGPTTDP